MAETPGTDLDVLVQNAQTLIATHTSVSMADLLAALSPAQVSDPAPAKVPAPRAITEAQRKAIARMPEVYGKVVPTERRMLEPTEVVALLDERTTLDEVKKTADARLKDITVIAHNHLDVQIENQPEEIRAGLLTDEAGHFIVAGKISVPDADVEFSRETRQSSATLPLEALEALETAGDIDHKTFLALTSQVRVVDEVKVMAAIKKDPSLLAKIAKATQPGKKGTSMYVRPKK